MTDESKTTLEERVTKLEKIVDELQNGQQSLRQYGPVFDREKSTSTRCWICGGEHNGLPCPKGIPVSGTST